MEHCDSSVRYVINNKIFCYEPEENWKKSNSLHKLQLVAKRQTEEMTAGYVIIKEIPP